MTKSMEIASVISELDEFLNEEPEDITDTMTPQDVTRWLKAKGIPDSFCSMFECKSVR